MLNFRCYQLSVKFYHSVKALPVAAHLKDQLLRAASSITLNFAEGYGKRTKLDRKKYFHIAFGSIRECQAILDISDKVPQEIITELDFLAASTYKFLQKC